MTHPHQRVAAIGNDALSAAVEFRRNGFRDFGRGLLRDLARPSREGLSRQTLPATLPRSGSCGGLARPWKRLKPTWPVSKGRWIRTFSTAARITEAAATAALRDQIRHAFGPVRLHRLDRKAPIQVWCNPDFRDRAPCSPRPRPGELDRNRRTCAGAQAEAVSSARRRAWLDGCPRPSCSTMPNAGRGAALISPSRKRPRQGPATGARRRSRVDRARAASPVAPGSRTAVSGAPATPWSSSGPRPGRPGGGRRRS